MRVVAVAYSGGRDSTALLHATLVEADALGCAVVALHVHHGLNEAADAWVAHCAEACRQHTAQGRPVDFRVERLDGKPARGESVEAWARRGRYAALARLADAHRAGVVLLGHHRRDQAETLLLQALRGGGVAGLAGMPMRVERDGIVWLRPWLQRSRAEIERYVQRHGLAHVDDLSNDDRRFDRNRLRRDVWPALEAAFAHAEATLAASANWARDADAALAELAAIDLALVADAEGLVIALWEGLSPPRRSLALRTWIRAAAGVPASASLISRLAVELPGAASAGWPIRGGRLVTWRGRLRFETARPPMPGPLREPGVCIRGPGEYPLPGWDGSLWVEPVGTGGAPLGALGELELRPRQGGEQFQAGVRRPPRSLKKQFQAAGVPACDRGGPLVYRRGQLVFVPGLGLDARVIAEARGEPAVTLRWRPGPAGRAGDAG